jgi:hypothetical protein
LSADGTKLAVRTQGMQTQASCLQPRSGKLDRDAAGDRASPDEHAKAGGVVPIAGGSRSSTWLHPQFLGAVHGAGGGEQVRGSSNGDASTTTWRSTRPRAAAATRSQHFQRAIGTWWCSRPHAGRCDRSVDPDDV